MKSLHVPTRQDALDERVVSGAGRVDGAPRPVAFGREGLGKDGEIVVSDDVSDVVPALGSPPEEASGSSQRGGTGVHGAIGTTFLERFRIPLRTK